MTPSYRRSRSRLLQLGAADLVTRGSTLVVMVVLARLMGPAVYGVFIFGYAAGNIAAAVVEGGLSGFLLREGALRAAATRFEVAGITRLRLVLLAVTALIAGAAAFRAGQPPSAVAAAVGLTVGLALRSVSLTPITALIGMGATAANVWQQSAERAVLLAGLLALALSAPTPLAAAAVFLVSGVAGAAAAWWLWERHTGELTAGGGPPAGVFAVLRKTWPFTLSTAFVALYFNGGALVVSRAAGDAQAGLYGAAFGLYSAMTGLSALLMKSVMPELAEDPHAPGVYQAFGRVLLAAVAVPGVAAAVAPELARVLLGRPFADAGPVLALMCAGAAASYVAAYFVYVLYAHHRERLYTVTVGAGLAVFLAVAAVVARRGGAVGVAGALAATEATCLALLLVFAARAGLLPRGPRARRPVAWGLLTGLAAALSAAAAAAVSRDLMIPATGVIAAACAASAPALALGGWAVFGRPRGAGEA